jgi:SPP1 gp7 family putative phage head morphogenesis protein
MAKSKDLSLDLTADPSEFAEAVEEFSKRRVISRAEADTIEVYARRRAWWISGVAQMDVANDAHQSIIEAMRDGVAFEDWKKTAGAAIEAEWGRKDSARLQLIFRNATSQAYNAGRLEQMEQPHIVAVRPYKMLDVTQDTRTSDTCRQYTNPEIVLPWDDPFWLTHIPPLHHGCRSGIRSLRRGPAERQGVTKREDLPDVVIPEGFGHNPATSVPPTPSERKNPPDPELQLMAAVKGGKHLREAKPVKVKQKATHTPEHWADHYREKYGEAAEQIGYGRAIHERSKAMSAKEAHERLEALRNANVPGVKDEHLDALIRERNKRAGGLDQGKIDGAKLLAEHSKLVGGKRQVPQMRHPRGLDGQVAANERFWSAYSSPKLGLPDGVTWEDSRGERAQYLVNFRVARLELTDGPGTAVHEFAHAVEIHGERLAAVRKFMVARTAGGELESLRDLFPSHSYGANEKTLKDKFYEAYIGKVSLNANVTELLSTVTGHIADGRISQILRDDPETLYFVLGLLAGV